MDKMPGHTMVTTCRKCGAPVVGGAMTRGFCARCLLSPLAAKGAPSTLKSILAGGPDAGDADTVTVASAGGQIGGYELLSLIAEGGMGVVYKARDSRVRRTVALKMILGGKGGGPMAIKRFRVEAEAVAGLDHPHIVPIYEVGEAEGQPFFTMKLIEGGSLATRMEHFHTDLRAGAKLMATVARAVHHAHQRGVLHRDLKPANILINDRDEPFVSDFGLARRFEEKSDLTQSGAIMGTPNYMAPEQALGNVRELTTAADVFSLGAILYHLLAGKPPFMADSHWAVLRLVQETEPATPSSLNAKVGLDLETICLKCLEKAPQMRYRTALELAEDLERWLANETIIARRSTPGERVIKWVRRKPVIASLTGVIIIAVIGGMLGVFYQWRVAQARGDAEAKARREAQLERTKAVEAYRGAAALLTRIELEKADDLLAGGNTAAGLAHVAQVLRRDPTNTVAASRILSFLRRRTLALPEVLELKSDDHISFTALSPNASSAISASDAITNNLRIWHLPVTKTSFTAMTHAVDLTNDFAPGGFKIGPQMLKSKGMFMKQKGMKGGQPSLALAGLPMTSQYSADGRRVATVSNNGTVRIWDAATGVALTPLLEHGTPLLTVEFSPDGNSLFAVSRDGLIRVWDVTTGVLRNTYGVALRAMAARFNRDVSRVLVAYSDRTTRIWNLAGGDQLGDAMFHSGPVRVAAWNPQGDLVCTATGEDLNFWRPGAAAQEMKSVPRSGIIVDVMFSPDGKTLVVSGDSGAELMDVATGEERVFEHPEPVLHAVYNHSARQLATISRDGSVHVWDVRAGRLACEPLLHSSRAWSARFTADDRGLIVVCRDGLIVRWTIAEPPPITLPLTGAGTVNAAHFSPDGKLALIAEQNGDARLWNVQTGEPVGHSFNHGAPVTEAAMSGDGTKILTAGLNLKVRLWDARTAQALGKPMEHTSPILAARFSPDGQRVLVLTQTGVGRVWDAQTGESLGGGAGDRPLVRNSQLAPDGRLVVVGTPSRTAVLYDLSTGEAVGAPMQHSGVMAISSFSADSARIITASFDNTARIWDARTTQPLTEPLRHDGAVNIATFAPDGRLAVTGSEDKTARIWDTSDGAALVHTLEHPAAVSYAEYSRDGRRLLTVADDFSVRLWDVQLGQPLAGALKHASKVKAAHFSPDGQSILTAPETGGAQIWSMPTLPQPAPMWLADLAEAIGGLRIDARGLTQPAARPSLAQLHERIPHDVVSDFYLHQLDWLFARPGQGAVRTP